MEDVVARRVWALECVLPKLGVLQPSKGSRADHLGSVGRASFVVEQLRSPSTRQKLLFHFRNFPTPILTSSVLMPGFSRLSPALEICR